ncbi:MAG: CapA family protein [Coriobacteriia bacterium]|nr:CapA family protein [Coriobacteriia bacterium]
MRAIKTIGILFAVVLATAAVTVAGLVWLPGTLVPDASATTSAALWPEATAERAVVQPLPPVERFTILAVGDLMAHTPQLTSARTADGYDFEPCFEPVASRIAEADLAIGNLETTLSGPERGYTGYPMFNTPDTFAEALVGAGFDVLTTANNHTLDRGPAGLTRTLDVLDGLGAQHTGTARTAEEAERVLMVDVGEARVAVLAYTYGMNGFIAPADKKWMVNTIDTVRMAADVARARELEPDLVIVSIHNGVEYQRQPSESQKRVETAMLEAGADVVLGSHPHVIQPMETVELTGKDGSTRTGFIIHSLGNFISNQRERYRNTGLLLSLGFEKDLRSGITTLVSAEYVPVWVDDTDEDGKLHRVLPIGDVLADVAYPGVDTVDRTRIQQAWDDTTSHLGGSTSAAADPAGMRFYDAGASQ